jgi:hypothetical protein
MAAGPIFGVWNGSEFEPLKRFHNYCAAQFVIGQRYVLDVLEERSAVSHSHYFACLTDAWKNFPDDLVERFPSVEHLRKYALIKEGFCDERSIVCASKAEAMRVAAFIKPMDDFALVTASESVVRVFTAKSQKYRAMGKEDFAKSKESVLAYVAGLIDVTPAQLEKNAMEAA